MDIASIGVYVSIGILLVMVIKLILDARESKRREELAIKQLHQARQQFEQEKQEFEQRKEMIDLFYKNVQALKDDVDKIKNEIKKLKSKTQTKSHREIELKEKREERLQKEADWKKMKDIAKVLGIIK